MSTITSRSRRLGTRIRVVGALLSIGLSVGALTTSSAPVSAIDTRQAEIDRIMALQPGGTQVSDNAVVWGDGDIVLVVPDPGRRIAPDGLGHNVRTDLLTTPSMRALDTTAASNATTTTASLDATADAALLSTHGCPGGLLVKDYYCFYQYRDWGGRRVQFTGATATGSAKAWGFNNGTTSWVSNDVDCMVFAYDTKEGRLLWRQPENSVSRYVGSSNDNKMSWWICG